MSGIARSDETGTFRARGLNHIALRVTDVNRSREFYEKHLDLDLIRQNGETNCFLGCGDNFVALFRSGTAGLDHYCYTIDGFDATRTMKVLQDANLKPVRRENRVYFDDPDGLTVQVSGKRDAWPG